MKAISVLFGGNLGEEAFVPLANLEKSAFELALKQAHRFPYTEKLILLGLDSQDYPGLPPESDTSWRGFLFRVHI